jgi:thiamine kinase-like enzyme
MDDLTAILQRLAGELGPLESEPVRLEGGITNRNYRVRLGGDDYVVRLCDEDAAVLGIDRVTEEIAARRAAADGIGPAVCAFLPDEGVLVTRFLPGGELRAEEVRSPGVLAQVAAALRCLHRGPALPSDFAVFRLFERQREAVDRVPAAYGQALEVARRVEAALGGHPEHAPVPCHNDLLTANFVRDGGRVQIVDWEYAGMNDRFFDLGNLSVNNDFGEDEDRALLELYFDEPASERRFAALRLMRLVSDVREGAWGVVQAARSRLDYDYRAYADEHFARMLRGAQDARVERWLDRAATA